MITSDSSMNTQNIYDIDPLDEYMATIEQQVLSFNARTSSSSDINEEESHNVDPYTEQESDMTLAQKLTAKLSQGKSLQDMDISDLIGLSPEEIANIASQHTKRKDILDSIDHSAIQYEPFRKNLYVETSDISKMTSEQVKQYREELDNIKIRGINCPKPIKKWSQIGLSLKIIDILKKLQYEKPTPIQAQAIPAIMSGRDVIALAKTGSGKTLAYLLPMFRHIADQRSLLSNEGPISLILTPTRELAVQVVIECNKFSRPLKYRSLCAYGGSAIKDQIADLKRGAEIVVCTPGRLIDLLCANSGRVVNLKRVTFLVIDEADRMFDMGFEPQVMKIIQNIRQDRQTVLFSATFPRQMEGLARKILTNPLEIVVGGKSIVCSDITQIIHVIEEGKKFHKLLQVLGEWYDQYHLTRVLIFVDRQDATDDLFKSLINRGYLCTSIHGGKDQSDRDSSISDFRSGAIPILIATSIAARGLDVKELNLVINYDCPNHMEDYVHRVGRTGRAGRKGTAITFITPDQGKYSIDLIKAMKSSGDDNSIPTELQMIADEYHKKVMSGEAQYSRSGFGGKGLENIEKERERHIIAQKHSFSEIDESTKDDEPPDIVKEKSTRKKQVLEQSSVLQEIAKRIENKIISEMSVSGDIKTNNINEVIPVMVDGKESGWKCEIEINNYPISARTKATHRDITRHLQDDYQVSLTVRGTFVSSVETDPSVRKLYILLEGTTFHGVNRSKQEILEILTRAALMEASGSGTSKYSVLR